MVRVHLLGCIEPLRSLEVKTIIFAHEKGLHRWCLPRARQRNASSRPLQNQDFGAKFERFSSPKHVFYHFWAVSTVRMQNIMYLESFLMDFSSPNALKTVLEFVKSWFCKRLGENARTYRGKRFARTLSKLSIGFRTVLKSFCQQFYRLFYAMISKSSRPLHLGLFFVVIRSSLFACSRLMIM